MEELEAADLSFAGRLKAGLEHGFLSSDLGPQKGAVGEAECCILRAES